MAEILQMDLSAEIIKLIPEKLARRHIAVPFNKTKNYISFAMADPCNLDVISDLMLRTGLEIKPYLALPQDIFASLDAAYGKGGGALIRSLSHVEGVVEPVEWAIPKDSRLELVKPISKADIAKVDASAPEVEKLVNAIILNALALNASDIHIEPMEDPAGMKSRILLRFRVDGALIPGPFNIPWAYRSALVAKIKVMTNSMNITERRLPQSGRIQVLNKGNPIEFRVEMMPTVHGEACVMRILDRRAVRVDIKEMGFMSDTRSRILDLFRGIGGKKNFGLVLVCGPVGCEACKGVGFKGRLGLHELLVMTDELRAICMQAATVDVVRVAAQKAGMRTINQDGLLKSLKGETTVYEVLGWSEEE